MADALIGITNRLTAGGAGTGCRDHPAPQAEEQASVYRRGMRHHLHIGGAGNIAGVLLGEHGGEFTDRLGAAGRRTVGDTGLTVSQHLLAQQPGLFERQFRRSGRQQRNTAHGANTLARIVIRQYEILDRGTEVGVQPLVFFPLRHVTHRILALLQPAGHLCPAIAERRNARHAGDDHSLRHTIPPLMEMTCRVT
ncbi:hypothetical protein D3C80_691420 [compost metagenome]